MNCANHPDRERVAFCQNCGKPLCAECMRTVGNSVFCEPCFAARGSAAGAPPGYVGYAPGPGYAAGQAAGYGAAGYPPYSYPPPGPVAPGHAEPAIAALLGFIPGVGAMYNGQYAKGIVHLVVFAVLCSLANDAGGIFGLFVAGWIFYMVIEAYHTARARRDGTPLPNPFGLNDLGERMGFGRAWPTPGAPYGAGQPGAQSAAGPNPVGENPAPTGAAQPGDSSQSDGSQTYSAPGAYFHRGADGSQTYSTPGAYFHRAADGSQTYGVPGAAPWGAPPIPPNPTSPPVPPMPAYPDPNVPYHRSIPTGAIWLIAIGALFMLGHAPVFRVLHGRLMAPFFLIGLGVWIFVRRMLETGHGLENDGTDYYRWRLANAMHGGMWMVLLGGLWLLNALHLFYWSHSWPVFLIAMGVLMIFRRTIFSGGGYGYGYAPPPAAPAPPASAVTSTEIVPAGLRQSDTTQSHAQHESDGHSGDGQEGK